jgi:RNA polymerase sigma-70 factor, ECF subfamily
VTLSVRGQRGVLDGVNPRAVAEQVARNSYGKLLAVLARVSHDIPAAEDALSEAFAAALVQWPETGAPENPEGWLVTAAKRRMTDAHRRHAVHARSHDEILRSLESIGEASAFADERLRLLFVCAHPAIEASIQVPLMLQTVLGLDAEQMAPSFRVAPKTLGQRLWRAKTKIRDANIPFEVPDAAELPERLHAVLEALYGAFGIAWEDATGADAQLSNLRDEALFLGRLVARLLPDQAEPLGLCALMLFSHARTRSRRNSEGEYVPLLKQDASTWDEAMLLEAESSLTRAFSLRQIGPYQLEAAIQSAHVEGVRTGRVDHQAIAQLYEALVAQTGSLGARVAHAAALCEAQGGEVALAVLDAVLQSEPVNAVGYQPYWAVRAEAALRAGHERQAVDAYERACGMTEDAATRAFLLAKMLALQSRHS